MDIELRAEETSPSSAEKRRMLASLLARKEAGSADEYPLAHGQRSLWFLYELDRDSSAYNVMWAAHINRSAENQALEGAFQQLVNRHPALRTTYRSDMGKPRQVIQPPGEFRLECVDARNWSPEQLQDEIQRAANVPFDLEEGPVFRVTRFERESDDDVLLMTAAHIALDFWSFDLLFEELESRYRQQFDDYPVGPDSSVTPYSDFVKWQSQTLESERGKRMGDYWCRQLAGELPSINLPTDHPRPPLQSFQGESIPFSLSDELAGKLAALAEDTGSTLFTTLLAAFQVLLFRYTGQTDILVGSPTAGRSKSEFESTLGYFLNSIVLRGRVDANASFREFLAESKQTVIDGIANQDFPFPLMVERLSPPRDPSRSPIFQVAFGWDKPRRMTDVSPADTTRSINTDPQELGLRPFSLGQQGSAFDLMLVMIDVGNSISAAMQYNSDLFDRTTIERMISHFQRLLESIVSDCDRKVSELQLLSHSEQRLILDEWNQTTVDCDQDVCLDSAFRQQAARSPDRVAARCDGQQLTYAQLDEQSDRLAGYLSQYSLHEDALVGIYMDRSLEMLVAMLAVLKSRAAWVPLTPGTPPNRLAFMLDETRPAVILTDSRWKTELADQSFPVVCLDTDADKIAAAPLPTTSAPANPASLAYVIFTSGSTGQPKGVAVEHRAVVNFLMAMAREPGITPDDILLAVTTITFDISILELFLPLMTGARVVIVPAGIACDGIKLAETVSESGSTIMQATPATWRLLLEAGWSGDTNLKILCGGESLTPELANQLVPRCASLWNMYGPTETTIWSTLARTSSGSDINVGRPIANTSVYILDRQMQPVPIGATGDLYIGGAGLARGYWNQPALTADRFLPNPFCRASGSRIYKTGDLARFRSDGRIDLLGRADTQIKLRGFRIELGEIQSVLENHPSVRQAIVEPQPAGSGDKSLVGYLVRGSEPEPTQTSLRSWLQQSLPDYMIPSSFIWMDEFPVNSAGKVCRRSLPLPENKRPELDSRFREPRDDREQTLVAIWCDVLDLNRIGIDDNFFELGGASIQSLEIAARINAELGVEATPALVFQHPTIADLATAIGTQSLLAPDQESPIPDLEPALESEFPDAEAQPSTDSESNWDQREFNALIESIGVYFPPDVQSSKEVLAACRNRIWFPLERMTGIRNRHVATAEDTSFDLARAAVEECIANSRYNPDDIDLLLCSSILRTGQNFTVEVEPNTAMQLKKHFGFENAIAFDVTNACTGMFTCIMIAEAFMATGEARRALIVSGEFITPIMRTAQKEISEFMDSRLACLTVGDAGAAAIVESTDDRETGFHNLEMYSLGKYSDMCIGKLTDQPHGGAIMYVPNPMEHTAVAVTHSVAHAKHTLERTRWAPEKMDHLIMHQTSDRSLRDGKRAINKAYKRKVCTDANTINNLADRGNTASTTHFVAIWDHILNGRIKSGDNTVFGITGSGQSIGSGIYTFDDLPDRIRNRKQAGVPVPKIRDSGTRRPEPVRSTRRVQLSSIANYVPQNADDAVTIEMSAEAARKCLDQSGYQPDEIQLLTFSGLTRTDAICEPATATMIAGAINMNGDIAADASRKTLAFDIYNSSLAFLNACQVMTQFLQSGRYQNAMVIASEVEQNKSNFPDRLTGVCQAATAGLLEFGDNPESGFGKFQFGYFTEHFDARQGHGDYVDGKPCFFVHEDPNLHQIWLDCIGGQVDQLLQREGLDISQIDLLLPPQFSSDFNRQLAQSLGIPRFVDIAEDGQDLFGMALPFGLEAARRKGWCEPGTIGLIVNVGAGVQVGCSVYYF